MWEQKRGRDLWIFFASFACFAVDLFHRKGREERKGAICLFVGRHKRAR
jgi:hypothetical protein